MSDKQIIQKMLTDANMDIVETELTEKESGDIFYIRHGPCTLLESGMDDRGRTPTVIFVFSPAGKLINLRSY